MLTLADLRPDARIEPTVEQLRRSAMELPNVGNDSQPFDAYRTKMLEMSRMLSNHFNWTSVDTWVFDDAYRRVFAERDRWALNHELDRRPRQLDDLRLTLIAQGERWAGDETIALLDANVVLTDRKHPSFRGRLGHDLESGCACAAHHSTPCGARSRSAEADGEHDDS